MSGGTIKGGNVQIGNDGTASNNFTWYQPSVADGTVRLGLGVAGATTSDVMVASNNGNVGIGTTSPTGKIDVRVTGDGNRIANLFNTTQAIGFRIRASGTDNFIESVNLAEDAYVSCRLFGSPFSVESSTYTKFSTSGSERMRIDANGDVEIGKTDGSQNTQGILLNGYGTGRFTATGQQAIWANRLSSDGQIIAFTRSGTQVGNISVTTSATTYNSGSDYRLKENIIRMTGALDKVLQLNPVTFTWKIDGKDGQGFIAHELAEVIPDAVTGEKDAVDAEGNPEYQSVDPRMVVATLVAAIQELKAEIDALKGAK